MGVVSLGVKGESRAEVPLDRHSQIGADGRGAARVAEHLRIVEFDPETMFSLIAHPGVVTEPVTRVQMGGCDGSTRQVLSSIRR